MTQPDSLLARVALLAVVLVTAMFLIATAPSRAEAPEGVYYIEQCGLAANEYGEAYQVCQFRLYVEPHLRRPKLLEKPSEDPEVRRKDTRTWA